MIKGAPAKAGKDSTTFKEHREQGSLVSMPMNTLRRQSDIFGLLVIFCEDQRNCLLRARCNAAFKRFRVAKVLKSVLEFKRSRSTALTK